MATQAPTQAASATIAPTPTIQPSATAAPVTLPAVLSGTVEATQSATSAPTEPATAVPTRTPTERGTATPRKAVTELATLDPGSVIGALPEVPTDIVELLRFAIRSESLKADNFNCRIYVKVMSNLKDIASHDDKGADDASDLVQGGDARQVLKYCADPTAPAEDHELPQDAAMAWGNVRLMMISVFARYAT
jgi:hypothetical protein